MTAIEISVGGPVRGEASSTTGGETKTAHGSDVPGAVGSTSVRAGESPRLPALTGNNNTVAGVTRGPDPDVQA